MKSLDLQEAYRELRLQNLELRNINFNVTHINKIYTKELNIYIAKQQKFIKYLEDEINNCEIVSNSIFNCNKEMKIYKEILEKYKKIIGGKDERK